MGEIKVLKRIKTEEFLDMLSYVKSREDLTQLPSTPTAYLIPDSRIFF